MSAYAAHMSLSGWPSAVKGLPRFRLLAHSVGRGAEGDDGMRKKSDNPDGMRKKSDVPDGLRNMSEDVGRA